MRKVRNLQRVGLVAVVLLMALALAACGGGGTSGAGGGGGTQAGDKQIEVLMGDFFYDPSEIEVEAGDTVTFVLSNEGTVGHDMSFDELGALSDEVAVDDAGEFVVQFDEAGVYDFHCTVPGHKELGMVGTVTVK